MRTPIGLVHTAWGGSTIEQWLTNETIAKCQYASPSASNQEFHDTRVVPYLGMSLKGFLWCEYSVPSSACMPRAMGVGNKDEATPPLSGYSGTVELTLPSRNRPN